MKKTVITLLNTFVIMLALIPALQATPEKNGFDLKDSLIPSHKVLHGGPSKDGIPSIDQPKFIAADQATFLNDNDRVIGIEINNHYRAYPIKILNWHEIVNDQIDDQPFVVTYCPLCGTGVVYHAKINGKPLKFGVSGLLYNSDVLLYDRQTQSLWSQILSKAITGQHKGTLLEIIASAHTRWGEWKKQHPKTQVLSTETGHNRRYNRSPYGDYNQNRVTYFPVDAQSKRYHPKERVLGLTIKGIHKAYPFKELALRKTRVINDLIAGQPLKIHVDVANREGRITDPEGNIIPTINSFWFAWYAFHPDTQVYKGK